MAIRIELKSETGTSRDPARALIYDDGELVAEIIATIEPKQGADGGYYPCVNLALAKSVSSDNSLLSKFQK